MKFKIFPFLNGYITNSFFNTAEINSVNLKIYVNIKTITDALVTHETRY